MHIFYLPFSRIAYLSLVHNLIMHARTESNMWQTKMGLDPHIAFGYSLSSISLFTTPALKCRAAALFLDHLLHWLNAADGGRILNMFTLKMWATLMFWGKTHTNWTKIWITQHVQRQTAKKYFFKNETST